MASFPSFGLRCETYTGADDLDLVFGEYEDDPHLFISQMRMTFTLFVIVLASCTFPDTDSTAINETTSIPQESVDASELLDKWEVIQFENEWGEPTTLGFQSPWVSPVRPMSFPWQDIQGKIIASCHEDDPLVRLFFDSKPLLRGGKLLGGGRAEIYTLSARVDGRDVEYRLIHAAYGRPNDLVFHRDSHSKFLRDISGGSKVAFLLPWYDEGNVRFDWPLTGFSEARESACGGQ